MSEDEIDVTELDELLSKMLMTPETKTTDDTSLSKKAGDWRDVERYLDEKRLLEDISDPLFEGEHDLPENSLVRSKSDRTSSAKS